METCTDTYKISVHQSLTIAIELGLHFPLYRPRVEYLYSRAIQSLKQMWRHTAVLIPTIIYTHLKEIINARCAKKNPRANRPSTAAFHYNNFTALTVDHQPPFAVTGAGRRRVGDAKNSRNSVAFSARESAPRKRHFLRTRCNPNGAIDTQETGVECIMHRLILIFIRARFMKHEIISFVSIALSPPVCSRRTITNYIRLEKERERERRGNGFEYKGV